MNQNLTKNGLITIIDWDNQKNYNGFDGKDIWPNIDKSIVLNNGLASVEQLDQVLHYKINFKEARLLYIQISKSIEELPLKVQKKFTFAGYDFGNYISEYNYYSLILHEVISGRRQEFKNFEKYLNENLLFSSLEKIPELEKTQIELRAKGEQLEDEHQAEEFQPIAVYVYKESN